MSAPDDAGYLLELLYHFRVEIVLALIILISIFADEIDRL